MGKFPKYSSTDNARPRALHHSSERFINEHQQTTETEADDDDGLLSTLTTSEPTGNLSLYILETHKMRWR